MTMQTIMHLISLPIIFPRPFQFKIMKATQHPIRPKIAVEAPAL